MAVGDHSSGAVEWAALGGHGSGAIECVAVGGRGVTTVAAPSWPLVVWAAALSVVWLPLLLLMMRWWWRGRWWWRWRR